MKLTPQIAALALAALLAACAQKPYPPQPVAAQTAAATGSESSLVTPAAALAPAAEPSSTWTSTYPYGTAEEAVAPAAPAAPAPEPVLAAAPEPEPTTSSVAAASTASSSSSSGGEILARASDSGGETITVYSSEGEEGERSPIAPFVSGWAKPGATPEQNRADIEACYRYAWSQVDHDLRIENDVAAARDDADKGLGFTMLTERMNLYDHKERRTELINDCMEAKGYAQR